MSHKAKSPNIRPANISTATVTVLHVGGHAVMFLHVHADKFSKQIQTATTCLPFQIPLLPARPVMFQAACHILVIYHNSSRPQSQVTHMQQSHGKI